MAVMWDTALHVFGLVLLFVGCLAALLSLVVGLPGTFIIVGMALLYAWLTDFTTVQWSTLGWLTMLALIAEGIEFASGGAGAAGARPSRRVTLSALAGALIGGIVGPPLLFGIGSLLGALAGAFAGAALAVGSEGGSLDQSIATGFAALKGRLLGFVSKAALAVVMVIVLAVAAL
jgi:hypothetical protein